MLADYSGFLSAINDLKLSRHHHIRQKQSGGKISELGWCVQTDASFPDSIFISKHCHLQRHTRKAVEI